MPRNNTESAITFDELLAGLDGGALNVELSDEMRSLMTALKDRAASTGAAKGSIAVTLSFTAANNGKVDIQASTTVRRPGPPKTRDSRWIDRNGRLSESDPRQLELTPRVVGGRREPVVVPRGESDMDAPRTP